MALRLQKNVKREHVWLRAFFMGPTGSGKSRAALELASKLYGGELPIFLINTERGREKLYADRYDYDLADLTEEGDYSPESYEAALDMAERECPGGVYVVDSSSHEWIGSGGILQQADRFGDWKTVRPKHNRFVERLLATNAHLIVTCRAKMKYEVGEEEVQGRKRQTITMLGVGPIQSDDLQYEFNLVARFDQSTKLATFSGHVDPLVNQTADLWDATEVAETLTGWLSSGAPPELPQAADEAAVAALTGLLAEFGIEEEKINERFSTERKKNRGVLSPEWVADQTKKAEQALAKRRKDQADAAKKDGEAAKEKEGATA